MKTRKIKFAVVGCGAIGSRHIAVIDAEPRAELAAICDIDEQKCKTLSSTYNAVPYFRDYKKMLASTDADVIAVCTPHHLHAHMAIEAARAGKHILVEKPMSLTVRDARKMIAEAKKHKVKLMVVKQNRFNTPIRLLDEALRKNKLGKIFMIQANILWNRNPEYYSSSSWRGKKKSEGGTLYTQASHFIDLLIWWCGDLVKAQSVIATKNHDIEIEDCGASVLSFKSKAIGNLMWTTSVYNKNYEGSIIVIGEKGTVKIGGKYLNLIEMWDVKDYPLPENISYSDTPNNYGKYQGTSSNHDKVLSSVIDELLGKKQDMLVFGEEGMKTIDAIEKIYESAKK